MEELTQDEIILSGLGRGRNMNNNMRLKKAVRSEMGASRFRKQFLERVHLLPKEIQTALMKSKAQISDAPYYSTGEIRGTRAEVIKLSNSEEIGITNIDNGKLNKDRHFILSAIRLMYDATSPLGHFLYSFPTQLLNAEWELELNNKKVFEKMPIRKFHDGFFGFDVHKPFGMYVLNNPKVISPQTPIEFNVDLPSELQGHLKVFLEGTTVYNF